MTNLGRLASAGTGGETSSPIPLSPTATLQRYALVSTELFAAVEARFYAEGVRPAADDLRIAAVIEDHLDRWRAVLDGIYAGDLTFAQGPDGSVAVYPRGVAS